MQVRNNQVDPVQPEAASQASDVGYKGAENTVQIDKERWVKNISSKPLTDTQMKLLGRGGGMP